MSEFRRRLMMAGSGGEPPIPYQRIEYLESTGIQWINTGISVSYNNMPAYYADIEFTVLNTSDNNIICGAYSGTNSRRYFVFVGSDGKWKATFRNVLSSSLNAYADTTYNIYYYYRQGLQQFYINSDLIINDGSIISGTYHLDAPCAIFGAYNNGSILSPSKMKLRKFKITYRVSGDEVTMFDGVPIRVGQTGYLYDKVSRELFGNSGTGDFIIGNDINT